MSEFKGQAKMRLIMLIGRDIIPLTYKLFATTEVRKINIKFVYKIPKVWESSDI